MYSNVIIILPGAYIQYSSQTEQIPIKQECLQLYKKKIEKALEKIHLLIWHLLASSVNPYNLILSKSEVLKWLNFHEGGRLDYKSISNDDL